MNNEYEAPEVIEIGNASDLILGANKLFPILPDGIGQPFRTSTTFDDDQTSVTTDSERETCLDGEFN